VLGRRRQLQGDRAGPEFRLGRVDGPDPPLLSGLAFVAVYPERIAMAKAAAAGLGVGIMPFFWVEADFVSARRDWFEPDN
jgi:hypothetical protein